MSKALPKFTTHQEAWQVFMERMPDSASWPLSKRRATESLFLAGYSAGVTAALTVMFDAIKQGRALVEADLCAVADSINKSLN